MKNNFYQRHLQITDKNLQEIDDVTRKLKYKIVIAWNLARREDGGWFSSFTTFENKKEEVKRLWSQKNSLENDGRGIHPTKSRQVLTAIIALYKPVNIIT